MRRFMAILLTMTLASCAAVAPRPDKACFHLNEAVEARIGYCQAKRSGDLLYVSGSVGEGAMPEAIRMAYGELRATLLAHGLTFQDVTKESVYTTDLDAFIKNQDVRKEFYGTDFPAATWVQVQRLYHPDFVVEVELTARMR